MVLRVAVTGRRDPPRANRYTGSVFKSGSRRSYKISSLIRAGLEHASL